MKKLLNVPIEAAYDFCSPRINATDPLNWLLSPAWAVLAIALGWLSDRLDA